MAQISGNKAGQEVGQKNIFGMVSFKVVTDGLEIRSLNEDSFIVIKQGLVDMFRSYSR